MKVSELTCLMEYSHYVVRDAGDGHIIEKNDWCKGKADDYTVSSVCSDIKKHPTLGFNVTLAPVVVIYAFKHFYKEEVTDE